MGLFSFGESPIPMTYSSTPGTGMIVFACMYNGIGFRVLVRRKLDASYQVFSQGFLVQPESGRGYFRSEPVTCQDDALVFVQNIEVVCAKVLQQLV